MITPDSSQKDLDLRVKYLFTRVLENSISNEKLAMDAVARLDSLSVFNFLKASFKPALLKQYQEHAETIKEMPEMINIIVRYLPVYLEGSAHHLVSQDEILNAILIEKLFEQEEWVVNMEELSLVAKQLDKYDKPNAFCTLLEHVFTEEYADFRYFTQEDRLIAPLLRMSTTSSRASEFIIQYEDRLVDLVQNHRNFLNQDHYGHYMGGINTKHADCNKFIHIGAKSLAKAVFENSLCKLTGYEPLNLFSSFANELEESISFRDELLYRTFALFQSSIAPYRDTCFKYFAYGYIHSDYVDLPFHPDESRTPNGRKSNPKNGLFLNKPEFINGLNSAIEATSAQHQDRVHRLIHKMKLLVTEQDVLAEMARQIPQTYLQMHPDLKRHLLADDLSL